ncbi:hypothetical protein GQ53DRAFT_825797 [Thozetella sp. PMI_491]|nr:hypothetical protein GQ53DRAFT_825797 [Thozetella sp. PMI_491]
MSDPGLTPAPSPARRPQACERCWKRKQKCDKLLPSCTTCAELRVKCNAREAAFDVLSEEGILSHTLAVGYVDSLKRKVDQLESDLQASIRKRQRTVSGASRDPVRLRDRHDSRAAVSSPGSSHAGDRARTAASEDGPVRTIMGNLSRSAMAEARDDSDGLPRQLAWDNTLMAALALDGLDPSRSMLSPSHLPQLAAPDVDPLSGLSRSATIDYVQLFVEEVCLCFPYLAGERVMEDYEAVMASKASSSSEAPLRFFTVYMALAIGTLLSPNSERLVPLTLGLHAAAVRLQPALLQSAGGLSAIQCMLTLAIYSTFSANGGSTWHLVGLAMKKCVSLGLHKEPDSELPVSEINERKRLFWSVYLLERLASYNARIFFSTFPANLTWRRWLSLVMDRPFSIQDEDITVDIPDEQDEEEDSGPPSDLLAQHIITHARVTSQVRKSSPKLVAKSSLLFHSSNLSFWKDFPPCLDHLSPTVRSRVFARLDQLACRTSIQMILTAAPNSLTGVATVEMDTVENCRRVIERSYERLDHEHLEGSFLDAYDLFSAGVVLVCVGHRAATGAGRSDQDVLKVISTINKCSTVITAISRRFTSLKAFRQVLLALTDWLLEGRGAYDRVPAQILTCLPQIVPARLGQLIKSYL